MSKGIEPDKIEALKQAVRKANEFLKDLKAIVIEARELQASLPKTVSNLVDTEIAEIIRDELEKMYPTIQEKMDESVATVLKRFDKFSSLLMGEDQISVRKGVPSLEEMLEAKNTLDRFARGKGSDS